MLFIHIFSFSIFFSLYNSYKIEEIYTFQKKNFRLNEYIILKYKNDKTTRLGGSIFFIFDVGYKSSTNIFLYDSYDKIEKTEIGFINYIHKTSLSGTDFFEIKKEDDFFSNNITYYLVLYDISESYNNCIYVVNTLDFFPLYDSSSIYYIHKTNPQLVFNFIIPKNSKGYLHYQTRKDPFNVLGGSEYYYIRITNNNGTTFIDRQTTGENGYIKIDSNLEFYVQIAIIKSKNSYKPSSFKLSFTNSSENFLVKDEDINVDALSPQHFSFFKNISHLNRYEKIKFNGIINKGSFGYCYFFIKYYASDNFEKLVDAFPKSKQDFDREISSRCENFNYEIEKTMNSQKGILLGIFVETYDVIEMDPMSITVYGDTRKEEEPEKEEEEPEKKDVEPEKEDEEPEKKDDYPDSKSTSEDGGGWKWIIILICLFIKGCCLFGCILACCENSTNTQDLVCLQTEITVTKYESYD